MDRGDHGGMEFGGKMGACSKDGVQHDSIKISITDCSFGCCMKCLACLCSSFHLLFAFLMKFSHLVCWNH